METQRIKKVTLDEKTYRAVMDKLLAQEAELTKLRDENRANKLFLSRSEDKVRELTEKIKTQKGGGIDGSFESLEYERSAPQRLKDIIAANFSLDAVEYVNAFKIATTSTRYLKAETEGEFGRFVTEQKTTSWKLLLRSVSNDGDKAYVTGFIDGMRAPVLPPPIYEDDGGDKGDVGVTSVGLEEVGAFVDVTQDVARTLSNLPQPPPSPPSSSDSSWGSAPEEAASTCTAAEVVSAYAKIVSAKAALDNAVRCGAPCEVKVPKPTHTKTIANKYKVRRAANQKTMKQIRDELYLTHKLPDPYTA